MKEQRRKLLEAIGRDDQSLRPGSPTLTAGAPGDYRLRTQPDPVPTGIDLVNNPQHYQLEGLGIEAKHVIKAVLGKDGYKAYCKGNMIKYALRKKWDADEDVAKIGRYSQMYRGEDE